MPLSLVSVVPQRSLAPALSPFTHLSRPAWRRAAPWALAGLAIAALAGPSRTHAANGVWTGATNTAWATGTNWTGGVPNAIGDIADFSQKDLTAAQTVNLGAVSRTVGTLLIGDANPATPFSYTFTGSGGQLILAGAGSTPGTVNVVTQTATISSAILAGTLGFQKTGAGTLVLGNANNTFTGGITLNAGALAFATGALNNNAISVTGTSTLTWNTAGDVTDLSGKLTLADAVTLTLNLSNGAADQTVFASTIATTGAGSARVVKGNAGTLTITAPQNFTGGTQINNGRLILTGGNERLSSAGGLSFGSVANSGILQLGDATGPSQQTATSLARSGNASSTANAIVGGHPTVSTFTLNNAAAVSAANTPLLGGAGANENNLAIAKLGAGTWTIDKANTFAGDVTIGGGALVLANSAALGTGTKTVTISGTTNAPSLQLNLASGLALPSSLRLVTSNDSAAGAIVNTAGANVIAGNLELADAGFGGGQTRIRVNGGSLVLSGQVAPAATAATNRTLLLSGTAPGFISGTLTDRGAIKLGVTKTEAGTWTLTGANSYSGPTTVSAGRLNLTTAQTGAGAVAVTTGATLGLTLAASGQSLVPASLALSSGTLALDLGSFANPTGPVIETGALTLTGTNAVTIAGTGLSVGAFPLVRYTGALGGDGFASLPAGNLPATALPARVTANLVNDSANLQVLLNISAFDVPKWTAATNTDWDINDGADPTTGTGSVNWREAASNTPTRYLQLGSTIDSVLFDDTAAVKTVNLTATAPLTPASATVNTAATYTFTGPGKLSGTTSLVKQGPGTLLLANTGGNDFTGLTTITSGTLQLGDGVTANAGQLGTGAVVNHGQLTIQRLEAVTLANVLSGSGAVEKQGANTLTLSGNNSLFTGPIAVAAGTLTVGNNNALGSTAGQTTIAAGATLELNASTTAEPLAVSGTLSSLSGTSTANGGITLLAGHAVDVAAGTLVLGGAISGTAGLTKNNAGTLRLSGTSTFSGGLTVNAGTVVLASDQASTGGTTITSGTLQIGLATAATSGTPGAGDIALAATSPATAALTILRGDSALNVSNRITSSGSGSHTVTIGNGLASGVVTFSGDNSFTGNVTIGGGALVITRSTALGVGPKTINIASGNGPALRLDGSGGDLTLASDLSFRLSSEGTIANTAGNTGSIVNLAGQNTIHGPIALVNGGGGNGRLTVSGGTLTITGSIDASTATGARTLLLGGAGNGSVAGTVADWFDAGASANRVVSITKDGSGAWTLAGTNSFTGAVTVAAGTLRVGSFAAVGNAQPLGAGAGAVGLGAASTAGTFDYTGPTAATARAFSVTASSPGGVIRNSGGGELTLAGTITRNNSTSLTLTGGSFDVTGLITGGNAAASVVVSGSQARFSTANTYLGTTRVQDGATLRNGVTNALPATTTLTLGDATANSAGTYDLNGFNQTISGLSDLGTGARLVTNGAASGSHTLTISGASTFGGVLSDGPTATLGLTKSGTGTLTLAGANSYTGPTTVTGGTLVISGSLSGTTSISLTAGTLLLGAGDALDDHATLALGGGTFATGGHSEGTALAAGLGALILDASSTLDFGSQASVLHFSALGSYTAGTLNITNWTAGSDRLVFSGDEAARLAFESALPQGAVSFSGFGPGYAAVQFDVANFELVPVPEPGSTALLGSAALLGLVGFRERRRAGSRPRRGSHPPAR